MWYNGLLDLSAWQLVGITLLMTHVTIVSVTVYLHRYSAHRALELHPALKHFFRFWLWLTTAQNTREWTAIHRKHHAKCETEDDPHSPVIKGLSTVLRTGAELYRSEAQNPETLRIYGKNCPEDWIERNLYSRFPMAGISLMALIDLGLFGAAGITQAQRDELTQRVVKATQSKAWQAALVKNTWMPALLTGGKCVVMSAFAPLEAIELVARERCTWTSASCPPAA